MKALGIIRKIDELGRVVIPKEVRDSQGWKAGQPMEMFMSQEGMVLKAYKDTRKEEILEQLEEVLEYTDSTVASELLKNTIEFIKKG
jgi:AbrB family looped-hinge helix DNA binding protein